MSMELAFKILTLLRLVAFMVIFYLAFGLLVERYSTKPDSQLKAFARIICSPITRPIGRLLGPGADQKRLLVVGIAAVAAFWAAVVVLEKVLASA
ncbi:MAG TPA: hypothetical protein VIV57_04205 [Anaeromyxobacter sp.]